jgi:hypothetical protein
VSYANFTSRFNQTLRRKSSPNDGKLLCKCKNSSLCCIELFYVGFRLSFPFGSAFSLRFPGLVSERFLAFFLFLLLTSTPFFVQVLPPHREAIVEKEEEKKLQNNKHFVQPASEGLAFCICSLSCLEYVSSRIRIPFQGIAFGCTYFVQQTSGGKALAMH